MHLTQLFLRYIEYIVEKVVCENHCVIRPECSVGGGGGYLFEAPRGDDVVHPLHGEPPAQLDGLDVALARAGECGEQEAHGEGVVDVTERVDEGRVPGVAETTGHWCHACSCILYNK